MKLKRKYKSLQFSPEISIDTQADIDFFNFLQSEEFDPEGCHMICFTVKLPEEML